MTRIAVFLNLFFISGLVFGQPVEFYEASYKMKRQEKEVTLSKDLQEKIAKNPGMMRYADRIFSLMEDLEYSLIFNAEGSVFQLREDVVPEDVTRGQYVAAVAQSGLLPGDLYYVDSKEKIKILNRETDGEIFLVEFPYDQYHWEITNETKMIHGFKCFKATGEWERQDYTRDILLVFNPVVWFTPELPFPYGPGTYTGLPGLVIDACPNDKICLSLTGFKKGVEVKAGKLKIPKNGKRIYYKDYDKMLGEIYPHH